MRGAAFVEIYQHWNVYNDGGFDALRDEKESRIPLEHGKPSASAPRTNAVSSAARRALEIVDVSAVGEEALLVHDEIASEPSVVAVARGPHAARPTPIGIFRDVECRSTTA